MSLELSVPFNSTPAAGGGLYAVIRAAATVWNGTAFVAWVDADIANYDVALAAQGGDLWAADFPAAIGAGSYLVNYYERTGASPTITDLLLDSEELYWTGTAVAEPPADFTGRYTTSALVELYAGLPNARAYGDADSDGTVDPGAYRQAILWSEAKIDKWGRGPFTPTNIATYATIVAAAAAEIVGATSIQEEATRLAVAKLYYKRGSNDEKTGGDFAETVADVKSEMKPIAARLITLAGVDYPAASDAINYPVVVDGSEVDTSIAYATCPVVWGF